MKDLKGHGAIDDLRTREIRVAEGVMGGILDPPASLGGLMNDEVGGFCQDFKIKVL